MNKKGIVIVALGYPLYGNCAFNLALSLKNVSPEIPIALVYEDQSISELTKQELQYFDEFVEVDPSLYTIRGTKQYQRTKLCVYDIAVHLGWNEVMYMDADNLWFNHPVEKLFEELSQRNFFIGCNGQYDVRTNQRTNKNYTYWSPSHLSMRTVCRYHNIKEIVPQTISGFFYFKVCEEVKKIFNKALKIYDDPNAPTITWANGKPDEYCFNYSLASFRYTQEKAHIFHFDNVNGSQKEEMMRQNYYGVAIGGNQVSPKIVHLYNKAVNELCLKHGIESRHYHVNKKDCIKERQSF